MIPILYLDDYIVVVDKPAGLLVHRSPISEDEVFLLQSLRDQLGRWVYPVHRLDRPTSGVIVFGLNPEVAQLLCSAFESHALVKTYWAIVRGFTAETDCIDYALQEEPYKPFQAAITRYRRLAQVELDCAVGRYPSARYSLLEINPQTGRMHQIRKHMSHIFHPVIGDVRYGDNKHNRFWREQLGIGRLMLFARRLVFPHPLTGERLVVDAALGDNVASLISSWGWSAQLDVPIP